jgi:hypothetical protein
MSKGDTVMARAVRIAEITLKPGVKPEEFERFVTEELTKAPFLSGISIRFLKCDGDSQGERIGMYVNELEFASVDLRDRYFPKELGTSAEVNAWWEKHGMLWDKMYTMVDARYIDYVEYSKAEGPSIPTSIN